MGCYFTVDLTVPKLRSVNFQQHTASSFPVNFGDWISQPRIIRNQIDLSSTYRHRILVLNRRDNRAVKN